MRTWWTLVLIGTLGCGRSEVFPSEGPYVPPPGCGNGALGEGEQCDDGNLDEHDGCLSNCLLARCGDGLVRTGVEECDDGNDVNEDFCDNSCRAPVCGDAVREGAEECDLGAQNGDRAGFVVSQPSGLRVGTSALVRLLTAQEFFDYRSGSSHVGLEQSGEGRIFLYADARKGRLSLFLVHGIDLDSTGSRQEEARVELDLTGLPAGFTVDVADDGPDECYASGPSSVTGRFWFEANTDGCVIGGLPQLSSWKIEITPRFLSGMTRWAWVSGDLTTTTLAMNEPLTIESIEPESVCRLGCVMPRCGNAVVEGGEVCDDGNTEDTDRCATDCLRLR